MSSFYSVSCRRRQEKMLCRVKVLSGRLFVDVSLIARLQPKCFYDEEKRFSDSETMC